MYGVPSPSGFRAAAASVSRLPRLSNMDSGRESLSSEGSLVSSFWVLGPSVLSLEGSFAVKGEAPAGEKALADSMSSKVSEVRGSDRVERGGLAMESGGGRDQNREEE